MKGHAVVQRDRVYDTATTHLCGVDLNDHAGFEHGHHRLHVGHGLLWEAHAVDGAVELFTVEFPNLLALLAPADGGGRKRLLAV